MSPKKTKPGSGKTNKNINLDKEKDEANIRWEIDRDWDATYTRRNLVFKKTVETDIITLICNHRKQFDKEGELLVMWNNGEITWSTITNVKTDLQWSKKIKNQNDVNILYHLKKYKLNMKVMGTGITRKKRIADMVENKG